MVPVVVVGVACTIWLYAFGVRRLLGLSLSIPRALLAGVVALAADSPIITAVASSAKERHQHALPGVWFVILGAAIALLVGMAVLVLFEALVPAAGCPAHCTCCAAFANAVVESADTGRSAESSLAAGCFRI